MSLALTKSSRRSSPWPRTSFASCSRWTPPSASLQGMRSTTTTSGPTLSRRNLKTCQSIPPATSSRPRSGGNSRPLRVCRPAALPRSHTRNAPSTAPRKASATTTRRSTTTSSNPSRNSLRAMAPAPLASSVAGPAATTPTRGGRCPSAPAAGDRRRTAMGRRSRLSSNTKDAPLASPTAATGADRAALPDELQLLRGTRIAASTSKASYDMLRSALSPVTLPQSSL
mmetsp:Transcript_33192/g.107345  ORF Transcript_33192/g.107345 Transcript_33192/m.107345 type:complete len:227 (+) Transcript_33192:923-1603(+)